MLRANEEDGACIPNLIYELAGMCQLGSYIL